MRTLLVVMCLFLVGCGGPNVRQEVSSDPGGRMKVRTHGWNGGYYGQSGYSKTIFCETAELDSVLRAERTLAEKSLDAMP